MIRLFSAFIAITVALLIPISCTTQDTPSTPEPLTIITHDSFDIGTEIIAAFEAEHNATVSIVKGGTPEKSSTKRSLLKAIL